MAKTAATAEIKVNRILVPLGLIRDNPYNVRSYFKPEGVADLAASIKQNGLMQVPDARPTPDGFYELAYGHMRFRAFRKLNEAKTPGFDKMPLNIRTDISDADMFYYSIEENLKRTDVKPLEVARCVGNYFEVFPDVTETEVAGKLNLEQSTIANYRRVLALPKDILDKINEGRINFSMGRELLVLSGLKSKDKDDCALMKEAVKGIKIEGSNSYGGQPATVDGIKASIDDVARINFRFLWGDTTGGEKPLWNPHTCECEKCEKRLKTWETKSQSRTWCVDVPCFDKHQKDAKEKAATEARKRITAEALKTVAARVTSAPKPPPKVETTREITLRVAGQEDTAKVDEKPATKAELVQSNAVPAVAEAAKVDDKADEKPAEKSTSPASIPQGISLTEAAKAYCVEHKLPEHLPCWQCINVVECDRTTMRANGGDKITCENMTTEKMLDKMAKNATTELPASVLAMVGAEMGTRAELLDLKDLRIGGYYNESSLKQGFVLLNGSEGSNYGRQESDAKFFLGDRKTTFDILDCPEECMERCIKGFHFAFDSTPPPEWKRKEMEGKPPQIFYVCSDSKCVATKKGIFTRARNEAGQAKRRAEHLAIAAAAKATTAIDGPRVGIIWSWMFEHFQNYGQANAAQTWLAKQLGLASWSRETAFKALQATAPETLPQLLIGYILMDFTYNGDVKDYTCKAKPFLTKMGIEIEVKKKEDSNDKETP